MQEKNELDTLLKTSNNKSLSRSQLFWESQNMLTLTPYVSIGDEQKDTFNKNVLCWRKYFECKFRRFVTVPMLCHVHVCERKKRDKERDH